MKTTKANQFLLHVNFYLKVLKNIVLYMGKISSTMKSELYKVENLKIGLPPPTYHLFVELSIIFHLSQHNLDFKIAFLLYKNVKIQQNQKYRIYFPGLSHLLIFIRNLFFNTIYNLIPIYSLIIQVLSGRKVQNKYIKKRRQSCETKLHAIGL